MFSVAFIKITLEILLNFFFFFYPFSFCPEHHCTTSSGIVSPFLLGLSSSSRCNIHTAEFTLSCYSGRFRREGIRGGFNLCSVCFSIISQFYEIKGCDFCKELKKLFKKANHFAVQSPDCALSNSWTQILTVTVEHKNLNSPPPPPPETLMRDTPQFFGRWYRMKKLPKAWHVLCSARSLLHLRVLHSPECWEMQYLLQMPHESVDCDPQLQFPRGAASYFLRSQLVLINITIFLSAAFNTL